MALNSTSPSVLPRILIAFAMTAGVVVQTGTLNAQEPEAQCPAGYVNDYIPCVRYVPGDLNCKDVGHFVRVVGFDRYGLDGNDNDGLGCESYPKNGTVFPVTPTTTTTTTSTTTTSTTTTTTTTTTTRVPVQPAAPVFCDGQLATIVGTDGDDVITGTLGDDVIAGLGGNDTIRGLAGKDIICGGEGRDRLIGGRHADRLFGEDDGDKLFGDAGADELFGGSGNDKLHGGLGDDYLDGGRGRRDRLIGRDGIDTCVDAQSTTRWSSCE